ncbi:hypothetical protein ACMFMG_005983 [Clarireedia jacksonii]
MQNLWSRAVQTRSSCRCSSCLCITAPNAARRITLAAGKNRITVGDIFTACYSTILATAAVADSNAKLRRREQWDQAIAEAKAGSSHIAAETSPGDDGQGDASTGTKKTISWSPKTFLQALRSTGTGPMTWSGTSWTAVLSIHRLETQLNTMKSNFSSQAGDFSARTDISPNTVPLNNEEAVFQSIKNDQLLGEDIAPLKALRPREPQKRIHLDRMEAMIGNLVTKLLAATNRSYLGASLHTANPDIFFETEQMMERIEELRHGDLQMPAYRLDSTTFEERGHLHGALRDLFKDTPLHPSNLNLILAKICYNLLVSSAPPSIITYNFLIERFSELMLYEHAEVLIDSFFAESRFRPTSKTVQVMLNHYAATNDLEGYRAIIKRMRGVDGDMRIGRRHKGALLNPEVMKWVQKKKRNLILRNGFLTQKVPRDVPIFRTLITTSLKISTVRQSVIQVDPEVLCNVVADCVAELDYITGESLLASILEHWKNLKKIPVLITLTKSARWALRELLHLCGIYPDQELPQQLPLDVSRLALGRLLFYLKLGSAHEQVERSVLRIRALQAAFGIIAPSETPPSTRPSPFGEIVVGDYSPKRTALAKSRPLNNSLDLADDVFEKFIYMEKNRAHKAKYTTIVARRVILQSLESKVDFEHIKLLTFEMRLVSWYYDQFNWDWRQRYRNILKENLEISMDGKLSILRDLARLREVHRVARKVQDNKQEVKNLTANVMTYSVQMAWLRKRQKVRRVEQQRSYPFEWRLELRNRRTGIGYFKKQKSPIAIDRSRSLSGSEVEMAKQRKNSRATDRSRSPIGSKRTFKVARTVVSDR